MKRLITFLAMTLLFAGCEKIFEDYDKRTYYDVTGVGYVYYKETKEPVPDARVFVQSHFRSNGYATVHPIGEYYPTDSSGYFCVRFMKRTKKEDVLSYHISANKDDGKYYLNGNYPYFTAEDLQMAKSTIQIDTLWIEYNAYWQE